MSNKLRGNSLYFNSIAYSAVTVVLLMLSMFRRDPNALKWAGLTFGIMILSLAMSFLYFETTSEQFPIAGTLLSFILLLPLGTMVFIISFILSIFKKKDTDEGGDYYD